MVIITTFLFFSPFYIKILKLLIISFYFHYLLFFERMPVGVLHCCQDAFVMQAVERMWCVPGKHNGTKSYIPFTCYWMLLMNMLKKVDDFHNNNYLL